LEIFTDMNGAMLTMTPAHVPATPAFEAKMRHFVDVCLGGRYNEVPCEHGMMVQEMIEAMYTSAERGREVVIG
jgi:predicted dehydrogenase